MKNILITFFLLIILSCKKDGDQKSFEKYQFDLCSNCTDTDIPELEGFNSGYQFIVDSNNINYTYFNPNNPNEFLYYNQSSTDNIFIYDRITNSKKMLTHSHILSPPKWGKGGWILIDNGSIYAIKYNGDSLHQLCTGYNPEWDKDGNLFAYDVVNWNIGKYVGVTYNFQSNIKDTFPFMFNAGKCWQNNSNKMIFYSSEQTMQGFVLVDMNTKIRILLDKIESPGPPYWINETEFIYTYNDRNLNIFNINTGITKTIAKLCSNDQIGYMSYSPISKELITTVNHWKHLGGNNILVTSKIMILNFNDNSVSYISP